MKFLILAVLVLSVSIDASGVIGQKSERAKALSRHITNRLKPLSGQTTPGQFEFVPIQRMTPPAIASLDGSQGLQGAQRNVQSSVQTGTPSPRERMLLEQQQQQLQLQIQQRSMAPVQQQQTMPVQQQQAPAQQQQQLQVQQRSMTPVQQQQMGQALFQQQPQAPVQQQQAPAQQQGPSQRELLLQQQQQQELQRLIQAQRSLQQQPQAPVQQQQAPVQQQQAPVQQQMMPMQPPVQVQQQMMPMQPPVQVQQQMMPMQPPVQVQQQQVQVQPVRQGTDFCRNAQQGDIIPHPQFQSQFIICYGLGEFTVMDCPQHLVYNPHLQRCDLHLDEPQMCASNPCMNEGKCVELGSSFRCECPAGFAGQHCERQDSCTSRPCGADGFCLTMQQGSPIGHVCICNGGRSFGQTCAQAESNPCVTPGSNLRMFPTNLGASVFAHCEGSRPHFKFCQQPLVFSPSKQSCDWL